MKPFLKICSKCRKQKWNSEFHKDKYSSDKYDCFCKDCKCELSRNTKLKKKYNITIKQYELILKSQNQLNAQYSQSPV